MTKKPDRWERMVKECYFNDRSDAADAIRLLRNQHRAVVRMVKRLDAVSWKNMSDDFQAGQHNAYMTILSTLNERAR